MLAGSSPFAPRKFGWIVAFGSAKVAQIPRYFAERKATKELFATKTNEVHGPQWMTRSGALIMKHTDRAFRWIDDPGGNAGPPEAQSSAGKSADADLLDAYSRAVIAVVVKSGPR